MTDRALLDHISTLPHARATFKQLVRELSAKSEKREELEDSLDRLVARGDLLEVRTGNFVVTERSREFAVGRLNMHRDGYGFLISERPVQGVVGDVFIPPDSAEKAMHGDRVVVRIARIEHDGRADGEIVKILKRAHATWSASSKWAAAASTWRRPIRASSSGSTFPTVWKSPRRGRWPTESA